MALLDVIYNTSIPGSTPNPFDLSDLPGVAVDIRAHCSCDPQTTVFPPLSCATHPGGATTFLFRSLPEPQLSPLSVNGECQYRTIAGLKNTISYHVINNGLLDRQIQSSHFQADGNHERPLFTSFDPNKVALRGYEQFFGDEPGYSRGRTITVEGGKLAKKLIENPYKTATLTVSDSSPITLTECEGKYIKEIVLTVDRDTSDDDRRSHFLFRYDVGPQSPDACQQEVYRDLKFTSNESVIDNVFVGVGKQTIPVGWATADYIEIRGYQPKITSATMVYMEPEDFRQHVVFTDAFDTAFDAKGRLFVFFEDTINYTELPYTDCPCPVPVPPPVPTPTPSPTPSPGGSSGGGSGSGGGGSGGGGGGGTGGIPGGGAGQQTTPPATPPPVPTPTPTPTTPSPTPAPTPGQTPPPTPKPKPPCFGRDCLGCSSENVQSHNSFTVRFDGFTPQTLSFKCEGCDGDGFVRILDSGIKQIPFCLIASCGDDASKQCNWQNTFFVPAVIKNSKVYGCEGYHKVLLPFHVSFAQTGSGWNLEAYVTGPDCQRYDIFHSQSKEPCHPPVRMLNDGLSVTVLNEEWSKDECALRLTDCVNQYTGTISCVMSPDLGRTWFLFKGLIRITHDKKAVKPFIAYDPRQDKFHLFWVERDAVDEELILSANGTSGKMKHVSLPAYYFSEADAFKDFLPFPSSSSTGAPVTVDPNNIDDQTTEALAAFTEGGKTLRKAYVSVVVEDDVNMVNEYDAAYVDAVGRPTVIRFDREGTLRDKFTKLTRLRRTQAKCGNLTWVVSGITDQDCGCKDLNGVFELELITNPKSTLFGLYVHDKWTMEPSPDSKYWVIKSDEVNGPGSGMLTFRRRRNSSACPPHGEYELICNRCNGTIKGTIDSSQELNVVFQGRDIPNSTDDSNNVDLGVQGNVASFTIENRTNTDRKLTGNPLVKIVADAGTFSLSQEPGGASVPAGGSVTFGITVLAPLSNGFIEGHVRIDYDGDDSPYEFRIVANNAVATPSTSTSTLTATGEFFTSDAIGIVLFSNDGGKTWQENGEIKAGHFANITYNHLTDRLFVFYVVDTMLFARAYRSMVYSAVVDPAQAPLIPENPKEITQDPNLLIPNADIFQFGVPTVAAELNFPTFFNLPVVEEPGFTIPVDPDTPSIARALKNEKDPKGIPTFLVGNKQGDLINAFFPYPDSWTFDAKTAVGPARPAAYITPSGQIRFFYVDSNGNVNGGSLRKADPFPDTKVVYKNGRE
jgi:hypothetical protein